jgi:uncharacterized protein
MAFTFRFRYNIIVLMLIAAVLMYACSKKTDNPNPDNPSGTDDFKKGMLTNYADNIIVPAYADLNSKLATLEIAVNAFLDAPSVSTQDAVRVPFRNAYLSYESVSVPFLGPAAALLLNTYLNSFPAATANIEIGIQSGTYDFTLPVTSDSIQGFPALDYLLFAENAPAKYSEANNANRKKYVTDVITRMKTLVSNTLSQWNGTYRTSFINALKTDVGSSIGFLVNQFAYDMDALKGPRIGWPFGKQSNGIVFADKCEGYYSGISAALAVANLTSLKNYYTGAAGNGIADYLVLLKKDQLNNDVLAQFDVALTALKAIPDPMSAAFTNNAALVEEAYKQVQKLLTLLKTDVASATGVQITYMDNDGD